MLKLGAAHIKRLDEVLPFVDSRPIRVQESALVASVVSDVLQFEESEFREGLARHARWHVVEYEAIHPGEALQIRQGALRRAA